MVVRKVPECTFHLLVPKVVGRIELCYFRSEPLSDSKMHCFPGYPLPGSDKPGGGTGNCLFSRVLRPYFSGAGLCFWKDQNKLPAELQ